MSTFQQRLEEAIRFEKYVNTKLNDCGWVAEPFGQGQLTETMRGYLRDVKTAVRWMPDIIAAKKSANGTVVVYVDAKAGDRWKKTGNHDVEIAAVASAEKWIELAGDQSPYYFVFSDGGVATPALIREHGKRGPNYGNGSGTPFLLFPTTVCKPFNTVFTDRP